MLTTTKPNVIYTELGTEKRCTKCGEYWPADTEFFYRGHDSFGLHSWCKACCNDEVYRRRKEAKEETN